MNSKVMKYFAFAGMMIWCGVIVLRGTGLIPYRLLNFCYIGPNLGSALALPYFYGLLAPTHIKDKLASRYHVLEFMILLGVFILSETIHAVFLGASFDWKDIAASFVGLGVISFVVNSRDLDWFIR